MKLRIVAIAVCGAVCGARSAPAQTLAGCTLVKGYYRCNPVAFEKALKDAKTVVVQTQPFDRGATKALGDLIRALDKTETSGPADLTFLLIRPQAEGILYGPGDRELASLSVYSRGPQGARGQLIWIESYRGQPDMAWAAVVHQLIAQFKASIK